VKRKRSGALKKLVWSKHIYVFLVHVFYEAFYFQTLLKVVPGYRVFSAEIWSRFGSSKERHVVYNWWSSWYSLRMSVAPVRFDFGSHDASVIG
jgi:hypothetical protein